LTLIEMSISIGLLGIVAVSVLSIAVETTAFLGDGETDLAVQTEAARVFSRMAEIVRKSGRMQEGGVAYPRVVDGGAALEFRLLKDADANGYGFDGTSGELEWSDTVYTLRCDESGNLGVYAGAAAVDHLARLVDDDEEDDDEEAVYHLGRFVGNLQFATVVEDSSLGLEEVRVAFAIRKPNAQGVEKLFSLSGSIHMRN
jgi:hypothetical protein